jgi:hypothetical protein
LEYEMLLCEWSNFWKKVAGVLLLPERALPSQPWHVRIINVSHGFVPGASVYFVSARHRSCRIVVRRIQLARERRRKVRRSNITVDPNYEILILVET